MTTTSFAPHVMGAAGLIMRETGLPCEAVGTSSVRPPLIPIFAQDMLE